jgi:hypothetical protein
MELYRSFELMGTSPIAADVLIKRLYYPVEHGTSWLLGYY